jgi:anti-anti-sigma regulatory factor
LITGCTSTQNTGGTLEICGLSDRLSLLFKITMIDKIIEVYTSEGAALEAFAGRATPR